MTRADPHAIPLVSSESVERVRIAALRRGLLAWYRREARDLPWRRTRDPYRIWLSEIMLQQTRVETVIPYYERFTRVFPAVAALARAGEARVLKLWEGLGYYSRARNLHAAAKTVAGEGSRWPRTAEEWRRLPGVGRYTAGAIASIAFGERAPVLDGNVKRVLARLFEIERPIDEPKTAELMWGIAESLVPPRSPGDFNQSLMELGACICVPRSPRCGECPVNGSCEAYASGRQDELPRRREKAAVPHHDVVAAAIERRGRILIGKRPAGGLLGGLWEFPGGKVRRGEGREAALRREIAEELGRGIAVGPRLARVEHAYSHFRITLHVYRCSIDKGRPQAKFHAALRWVRPEEFERFAFPAATLKAMRIFLPRERLRLP